MSYTKPWKVVQDYGLGIANVGIAVANLVAQKAGWLVEHGDGLSSSPYNALGTHDTPPIPRAVVRVIPANLSSGFGVSVRFDTASLVVRNIAHISTGIWQVSMHPALTLFFADPKPAQSSNAFIRMCQPYGTVVGGAQTAITIKTYELGTGVPVLTDFEFSCAIYSYV